jgi:multidrug/hemolysin transport system ATP-binding protein
VLLLDYIIEVNNLVKTYDKLTAVNNINFKVKKGNLFAFLGPNGAGKSTTINIICTTLEKTSGSIIIGGFEIGKENNKVRDIIGVVYQESILDDLLTVRENLCIRAAFYNITKSEFELRLAEISDVVGISDFIDRPYGKLSGGQKRRADVARSLINKPKILFLDEPTTGLDPQTRLKVWDILNKLRKEENMTIFFTTHYMEEASVADEVVIIDNGVIVAQNTPDQLRLNYSKDKLRIIPKNRDLFIESLSRDFVLKNDIVEMKVKDSMEALQLLKEYESDIIAFEVIRGNMDDVFVNITGREIR